jgi:DNA-binding beta-propeller fold protein YncE
MVGLGTGVDRRSGFSAWARRAGTLAAVGTICLSAGILLTIAPERGLVSYDRLSAGAFEECAYEPAAYEASARTATMPLGAAFQQEQVAATALEAASASEMATRKPVRMIRDPYAAYSAVAVDNAHDEVVLTDENLFNILVYDRRANSSQTRTELKRIIGGLKTKIEFQCGLYIDPANGDIYAVNNDTIDTLVIFSRKAVGNVPPDRELHTPHGTFGIAVDEDKKEMFLTVQHDSAIVVFNKSAKGTEAPLRVIQGDDTGLADPHGMALDTKNNLLYVTNHGSVHQVRPSGRGPSKRNPRIPGWPLTRDDAVPGSGQMLPPSITVYSKDATGNAPAMRRIQGPKTQMNWPTGIAVDPEANEIFVANDGGNSILVFKATDNGDAAPIRVLKGPKSLVNHPTGVHLDKKNNELWVANFGNHTATVYRPTADGDVPPLRVIRSATADKGVPGMGNPHPIAYDTKREQILVPN